MCESACADGCPICPGAGSDIEHYYLAQFLNSRRVLEKLQVLFATDPATLSGDCLAAVAEPLLTEPPIADQPSPAVRVVADPCTLGNRLAQSRSRCMSGKAWRWYTWTRWTNGRPLWMTCAVATRDARC